MNVTFTAHDSPLLVKVVSQLFDHSQVAFTVQADCTLAFLTLHQACQLQSSLRSHVYARLRSLSWTVSPLLQHRHAVTWEVPP